MPTSTDFERVFSAVTWYCSKIRSRLSDVILNVLIFLKFLKQRNDKLLKLKIAKAEAENDVAPSVSRLDPDPIEIN